MTRPTLYARWVLRMLRDARSGEGVPVYVHPGTDVDALGQALAGECIHMRPVTRTHAHARKHKMDDNHSPS